MNKDIENIIQDHIFVPNSWLPAEFQNHRDGGRTLAELEELCDKRDRITPAKKEKEERQKRVALYRKQQEEKGTIDYVDINEDSQYKFEMAFAKYCPAIATDELEEELLDQVPKPRARFHKREGRTVSGVRTYRSQREEKDLLVEVSKREVKWK